MPLFTSRNFWLTLFCFVCIKAGAQCNTPISVFPYVEDFEDSAAWTTGGPACTPLGLVINDWAWGHPQKNVISSAGSGQRCWIVGDTIGWFYQYGERSWVQSPCFNFASVQRPYIQFKIFWESEYKYDGANLQYSLNGGTSWTDVGASTDPSDCMDANWYNYTDVDGLGSYSNALPGHGNTTQTFQSLCTGTSTNGWCGNIQADYHDTTGVSNSTCQGGHGLGQWVTAKHCMPYLAGQSSVIFRIAFGAGTACNDFNGFAFDSVAIGEGTPNSASFTSTCVNTNTLQFTGTAPLCPDTFQWDFGDPASGTSNTVTGAGTLTPTHTFSAPGNYNVTFTVKGGPCNAPGSVTQIVNVIGVTTQPVAPGCNGGGSAIAVVGGSAAPYTYTWSTSPAQSTDTATNLAPGNYTVTVTSGTACSATASVTITQPVPMSHTIVIDSASCGIDNGSVTVHESGGTPAYSFTWSPAAGIDSVASALASGSYSVTIVDSRGCRDSLTAVVGSTGSLQIAVNILDSISCFGKADGSAYVAVNGGGSQTTFIWSNTDVSDTISNLSAGTYAVTASEGGSCTATGSVTITQPSQLSHTVDLLPASCGNDNGAIGVTESGGTPGYNYAWSPSGSGDSLTGLGAGTYSLTITDANGCRDSLTETVASTSSLSVSINASNITCYDENNAWAYAVSNGVTPLQYAWSDLATTDTISNLAAGSYTVTVTDATHCTGTATASIINPDSLYATAVLISDSCDEGVGNISVTVYGGTSPYQYIWSPVSGTTGQQNALHAGEYSLTITDANACIVTEAFPIGDTCVIDSLVFPSAFTPNGDNRNDIYGPVYTGSVTNYSLHIYNRWGELVFESTDPAKGWDGNYKGVTQTSGVYTYFSRFTAGREKAVEGTFALFR